MASDHQTCLVVENDDEKWNIIHAAFKNHDARCNILRAQSFHSAKEMIMRQPIDLVVTDRIVDGKKGVELVQDVNLDFVCPIVLMDTITTSRDAVESIKVGAMDYIDKSPDTLKKLPLIGIRARREWGLMIEKRTMQKNLAESEQRFRSYFQLGVVGIAVTSPRRGMAEYNDFLCDLFGYTREEMRGLNWADLTHPEDMEKNAELFARVISGDMNGYRLEMRGIKKDGSIIYLDLSTRALRDEKERVIFFLSLVIDITEKKKQEGRLIDYQDQLRKLASKISLVEQFERRKIAQDLHDQIGQDLAFANLQLGSILKKCDPCCTVGSIVKVRETVEQVIRSIRTLTFELSSFLLFSDGLLPALQEKADQLFQGTGIEYSLRETGQGQLEQVELKVLLYQVVTELLVNASKHSHPSKVIVEVEINDNHVKVSVEDDGRGFDAVSTYENSMKKQKFGLFSARERLRSFGGEIQIDSSPDSGTRIFAELPIHKEPEL